MRADVQKIYLKTPHEKQVMMFSATMPPETKRICQRFMVDVRTERLGAVKGCWLGSAHYNFVDVNLQVPSFYGRPHDLPSSGSFQHPSRVPVSPQELFTH